MTVRDLEGEITDSTVEVFGVIGLLDTGPKLRAATNADAEQVRDLVYTVLAEYGLKPDPDATDADLCDIEKSYSAAGGAFCVLEDQDGAVTLNEAPSERTSSPGADAWTASHSGGASARATTGWGPLVPLTPWALCIRMLYDVERVRGKLHCHVRPSPSPAEGLIGTRRPPSSKSADSRGVFASTSTVTVVPMRASTAPPGCSRAGRAAWSG